MLYPIAVEHPAALGCVPVSDICCIAFSMLVAVFGHRSLHPNIHAFRQVSHCINAYKFQEYHSVS
jgi:TRAP-type C4-dicarboxylate transport system permease small subunit